LEAGGSARLRRHDRLHCLPELLAFRSRLHGCFTRRTDALFELSDAVLTADAVASLPHLSLEPGHRRGWGSIDAALVHGRIDTAACQTAICRSLLPGAWPVFAVDVSTWPRCDAEASPSAAPPTTRHATRPASRSWPAGPLSGSPSSARPVTAGPRRSTSTACTQPTTPIPLR
jgi:hypothetical protein